MVLCCRMGAGERKVLSSNTLSEDVVIVGLGVRVDLNLGVRLLSLFLMPCSGGDGPRCSLCLYMTCERTLRIVSPALNSSGWFATTNCIEGPGASGGRRFLPIRLLAGAESWEGEAIIVIALCEKSVELQGARFDSDVDRIGSVMFCSGRL
jgi:hypothetical protein